MRKLLLCLGLFVLVLIGCGLQEGDNAEAEVDGLDFYMHSPEVYVDDETGCEYLVFEGINEISITPRYDDTNITNKASIKGCKFTEN